jgi:hypothetical protein
MTMKFSSSVFAMAAAAMSLSLSLSPVAAETVLQQPEAYQQRLVNWIRSGKNGYFHPQVQWKRLGGSGPYAMHTTVNLPKGTPLLVVPRSHIIDSYKTHDHCVTVARMLGEYERGDDSFFAPYLSYLFDNTEGGTSTGLLPGSWSEEGEDLLHYILGNEEGKGLQPRNFEQSSVFDKCGRHFRATLDDTELEDEDLIQQAEDAHFFYLSRSWADKMVPVLDMYNHRNGKSLNVEYTIVHSDDDVTAFALRDIKAGEQLQNTYSECMDYDCDFGEIKYSYHTADVFNDYGFLEFYPRRWPLNPGNSKMIAEVDEDLETGEKSFQWIFETPSEKDVEFISDQLSRLRKIEVQVRRGVARHKISDAGEPHNNIPHEADSLLEIFEGYVEILEMALEHKNDPVGVTPEQFSKDLQIARRKRIEIDEL